MFHLISPNINFDFLGKSKPFVIVSTLMLVASVVLLVKPGLNFGIDFTGGAVVQLKVPADWDTAKLRGVLEEGGIKDTGVVQMGEAKDSEFLIRAQAEASELNKLSAEVEKVLTVKAGAGNFVIQKVDVVGPAAGETLRNAAFLSILYAILAIVVYITFRFDIRYAPGMLRALGFDVVVTFGIWVVLGREFNLTVLAAMLTVAGYSCNDTVVIYDRIRDYLKNHTDWSMEKAVNKSINVNLGRSIVTTLSTLFVVASMAFLGGPVLEDFSLPLLIGFTISVPSTLFVAPPLIIWMEKRQANKRAGLTPARA